MPLTVLIVDDGEGFRQTAALLEAGGFEVVGEAADGKSGIVETERLRPGAHPARHERRARGESR